MPPQAIALALAASIYPPAVAAIIALGRGPQLRSRVAVFVIAALAVTYALGVAMLLFLTEIGASGPLHYTPSASLELALGLALVAIAVHLQRRPEKPPSASKIERYLRSRRLAFALGLTLYVLPSPIYIGAVKSVADAKLSTSNELLALALTVGVMLWLIEIPMLMLLVAPDKSGALLERINRWFAGHGRELGVLLCAGAGVYLAAKGLAALIS
jgi:Sap, sulfolipid-1-addressing protein